MDIKVKRGQILKELRAKKGLKQSDMAEFLSITPQAYQRYEYGTSEPNADGYSKLADFYGVTTDYLLGREPPTDPFEMLGLTIHKVSDDEFIERYRNLPEDGRKLFLNIMRMLTAGAVIEEARPVITIRKHIHKASAGGGYYLFSDDDEFTEITVIQTPEAERADFAVEVEGDSMEPALLDGDLALIVLTPAVDVGQIGLFTQNGEGFIKKAGEKYLISLNPNYPNIYPKDGEIRTVGRVIGVAELSE